MSDEHPAHEQSAPGTSPETGTAPETGTSPVEDALARLRRRAGRPDPPEELSVSPAPPLEGPTGRTANSGPVPTAESVVVDEPVGHELLAAPPPASPPPPATSRPVGEKQSSMSVATLSLVALLAVGLCAVGTVLTMRLSNRHFEQQQRPAIIAAAVNAVKDTASYDYRSLDADERAAETELAEPLRSAYATRVAQQVNPLATKYHATSKASVDSMFGAGIVNQSLDQATVLLYVDQVVTNTQLAAPRLDQTRVLATMKRVGDRWLMSGLQTL